MDTVGYLFENFWACISVILTLFLGIQTLQSQKMIAEMQGVFKNHNIQLNLYRFGWRSIDADNSLPHNILIATRIPENGTILFPLLISLINDGDKSGKEILLLLRYPKTLHEPGLDIGKSIIKLNQNIKTNPRSWESHDFQSVEIDIGTLIPKRLFSFVDVISINNSTLSKQFDVDAVSKDGVPLKISGEYGFAYGIEYIISQDDSTPIAGLITIGILDTSQRSLVDYIHLENARKKKEYDKLSLYQKIKLLLNYKKMEMYKRENLLVVTCDESKIQYEAKGQLGRISAKYLEYIYYYEDITGQKYRISGEDGRIVGPYLE